MTNFLAPRLGRRMKPETARAIDARVAEGEHHRKRKRLNRAVAGVLSGDEALSPAFDRPGYNLFLKSWAAELEALPEMQRLEIENALRPFFSGRRMGKEFREIVSFLRAERERLNPLPVPRRSHAWGAPLHSGW